MFGSVIHLSSASRGYFVELKLHVHFETCCHRRTYDMRLDAAIPSEPSMHAPLADQDWTVGMEKMMAE